MFKPNKLLSSAGLRMTIMIMIVSKYLNLTNCCCLLVWGSLRLARACRPEQPPRLLGVITITVIIIWVGVIIIIDSLLLSSLSSFQELSCSGKTNNLNLRRHLTKSWRFAYIPLRLGAPARLKWEIYIGSIVSRLFASNEPGLFKEKPSIAIFYYLLVK